MQKYSYKNSEIEWLGEIPEHWNATKVKKEFRVIPSNVDKKSHDDEEEVKLCNYVDVYYNDFITSQIDFMIATASEHEIKKFQLQLGDILITKDSEDPYDIAVPALVKETEDRLLCGYHLSMIRSINQKIDGAFLFWSLKDDAIVSQLFREATGVTRWAIASRHIKNSTIAFPPLPEQKAIADYLDKACARIDRIIAIKKEQLKKIEGYFHSKVNEILSGGILQHSEFKETGFEWFKSIPSEWKVVRLKSVLSKINSGVTPKGGATSYMDEGIPLIRSQNIKFDLLDLSDVVYIDEDTHDSMNNSKVKNGDVLLNITGASLGRCQFAEGIVEANVNQHVCILRPFLFIQTKFLYFLLRSEIGQAQIFSGFKGSGREGLNFEAIKNFRIPLPSLEEQGLIAETLDKLLKRKFDLSKKVEAQISTLLSYRKSLIHECVTGKKQVADIATTSKMETI